MKKELDEQLCSKYPGLYRDRHGDKMETLMCWGFCCGDGWYTLIDVISALLTKHNPKITADQVKEKFGTLRFYHTPVDPYTSGIEVAAGQLSGHICEECGEPAIRINNEGWISTLCEKHSNNYCPENYISIDLSSVAHLNHGKVWSEMIAILIELCEWSTEKNDMPKAVLDIKKVNDKLVINIFGGDEFTKGMTDLFVGYANSVDEQTGLPHQNIGHSNDDL